MSYYRTYIIFVLKPLSEGEGGCACVCLCGWMGGGVGRWGTNTYLSKMAFTDVRKINPLKEGVTEMENWAQIYFFL